MALYAALASNRDKKEDPIDRSVINHFDKLFGPEGLTQCEKFTKIRGVGFNPIYKRVVFEFSHPTLGAGNDVMNKCCVLNRSCTAFLIVQDRTSVFTLTHLQSQICRKCHYCEGITCESYGHCRRRC